MSIGPSRSCGSPRGIDPFSAAYHSHQAWALVVLGRDEDALAAVRRALDINPDFPFAHAMLSHILIGRGRAEEGIRELQTYYRLVGLPEAAVAVEEGFRVAGVEGAFRHAAMRMEKIAGERFVSPSEIAAAFARGASADKAFEWLERAVAARDVWLWQLRRDLTLEPLRADPRFEELTRRLGLPE